MHAHCQNLEIIAYNRGLGEGLKKNMAENWKIDDNTENFLAQWKMENG